MLMKKLLLFEKLHQSFFYDRLEMWRFFFPASPRFQYHPVYNISFYQPPGNFYSTNLLIFPAAADQLCAKGTSSEKKLSSEFIYFPANTGILSNNETWQDKPES